jgi:AraC-like DNA-binding protein/mannose-6-phosphate isomerase-like protein (cupin superfamily)
MSTNRQTEILPHPGDLADPGRPVVAKASDHAGPHHFPLHRHLRAQLVYAVAGVMTVRTGEGTWVVPPQQAVWVPSGVEHEVSSATDLAMRTLYIHPAATAGLPGSCCVVTVPPLLRELILHAAKLPAGYPEDGPEARLMAVIPDQLRRLRPEPLHLPIPTDRRLRSITEALSKHPADGRSLGDWARTAGASERTLARLFKQETGMTFGAWRQRLRLLLAIGRLAEGHAVTAVAYDLGYESPSAFVAMFRRELGEPPARYLRAALRPPAGEAA